MNPTRVASAPAALADSDELGIVACPGLTVPRNAGPTWKDSRGNVHDLDRETMLSCDEVAASPLVGGLGFSTVEAVRELIRTGRLYPVFRKNARVIRVYACALPDFRARAQARVLVA